MRTEIRPGLKCVFSSLNSDLPTHPIASESVARGKVQHGYRSRSGWNILDRISSPMIQVFSGRSAANERSFKGLARRRIIFTPRSWRRLRISDFEYSHHSALSPRRNLSTPPKTPKPPTKKSHNKDAHGNDKRLSSVFLSGVVEIIVRERESINIKLSYRSDSM